jgi:hypothetical protein
VIASRTQQQHVAYINFIPILLDGPICEFLGIVLCGSVRLGFCLAGDEIREMTACSVIELVGLL